MRLSAFWLALVGIGSIPANLAALTLLAGASAGFVLTRKPRKHA